MASLEVVKKYFKGKYDFIKCNSKNNTTISEISSLLTQKLYFSIYNYTHM